MRFCLCSSWNTCTQSYCVLNNMNGAHFVCMDLLELHKFKCTYNIFITKMFLWIFIGNCIVRQCAQSCIYPIHFNVQILMPFKNGLLICSIFIIWSSIQYAFDINIGVSIGLLLLWVRLSVWNRNDLWYLNAHGFVWDSTF